MTEKPLLLMDVDGPLNPWPLLREPELPEGWDRHQLYPPGFHRGLWVVLRPAHGARLLELADDFELTWATSWEHHANTMIGTLIGLPELPVIDLPRGSTPFGQIWKRGFVEEYVGDRAFAWFDDEFQAVDYAWAKRRDRSGKRTRLFGTDPHVGLTVADFDEMQVWAAQVRKSAAMHEEANG